MSRKQMPARKPQASRPGPEEIKRLFALLAQGRPGDVAPLARRLAASAPGEVVGWHLLGAALSMLGRHEEALEPLRRVVQLSPRDAAAHNNLAATCLELGRAQEAEGLARRAAALEPGYAKAHNNLCAALGALGRNEEAEASGRRALALNPDYPEARKSLGAVLFSLKRLAEAEEHLRRALALRPGDPGALTSLGAVLAEAGRRQEAEDCFRAALAADPDNAKAHARLGCALLDQDRPAEAEGHLRKAAALDPADADSLYNLGIVLERQAGPQAGVECYRQALRLRPGFAKALCNLATALHKDGRHAEAEAGYRQAVQADPELLEALFNLGNALKDQLRFHEGLDCYRRVLERRADFWQAHSNLLFTMNFLSGQADAAAMEAARRFGAAAAEKARPAYAAWGCDPEPRRLRVGLVSGDLRSHPVGYFLEDVLPHLAGAGIELFAYPTGGEADNLTARIRPLFADWRPISGLGDAEAASLLHGQGLHLLLDLAGHTEFNRLPVFARRPAPVQASWLGYFATTGLAEMDYLLADAMSVPEEARAQFTESVWLLPETRLCFSRPARELPVAEAPALRNGALTFGSFQTLTKVNGRVLDLWARVLEAAPGSRLRVQAKQLGSPDFARRLTGELAARGVAAERLSLHAGVSRTEYFAAHAEVDVLLDTFPYPGGTTTCEALWMGVPTVTLAGGAMLSRQGAGLLAAAGLGDWIAGDEDEYVRLAAGLQHRLPELAELRRGLRARVAASALFDAPRFAARLAEALWGMWRERGAARVSLAGRG